MLYIDTTPQGGAMLEGGEPLAAEVALWGEQIAQAGASPTQAFCKRRRAAKVGIPPTQARCQGEHPAKVGMLPK